MLPPTNVFVMIDPNEGELLVADEPIVIRITVASEEEANAAFERYALSLGKVAHSWNLVHERLAEVFVIVVGATDASISLSIWHSTENDRTQRVTCTSVLSMGHSRSSSQIFLGLIP